MLSRREFLTAAPLTLAALAQSPRLLAQTTDKSAAAATTHPPKIGLSSRTADVTAIKPGQITTASPKVCKILQVTDFHFFAKTPAEDEQTIADCRKHIELHHPDLVVVSGDL